MVSALLPRLRIDPAIELWKDELPAPFGWRVWILSVPACRLICSSLTPLQECAGSQALLTEWRRDVGDVQ